ncbi:LamG domain-containing protein, partial [Candidatus Gottesmanbacteria bacterium]|nr:LamG domain-containing protein [Candidatus Gottesmanbacteria bacterium]
ALTIAPTGALVNITGDLDVSDQGAFGNAGVITAGQVLRVDNSFTDTSGSLYGAVILAQADPGSASTGNYYGLSTSARLDTTNGANQLNGLDAVANVAAAGTVSVMTGSLAQAYVSNGVAATVTTLQGINVYNPDAEDATVTTAIGISVDSPSVDTGSITNAYGIDINAGTIGSGTIANLYPLNIDADSRTVTTNKYGLYMGTMSGAANNYQLYIAGTADNYFEGKVGIGDTTPDAKLEVLSTTEQLRLTETDTTSDCRFTVDPSGNLTLNCTGTKVVLSDDLQVSGNDILDSGAVTRLTIGATNTFNGRLAVANNGLAAVGQSLVVFDQYEQQDILTASASGVPRAAIERTGDYKMFGPKTQSTIASINDVYVYDTTADSDGGAWTNSDQAKASSWYNETIDNTGAACVIGTDDRCGAKPFPKRAVIEADASNVRIYNAEDQTMWMRFTQGSNQSIGADSNNDPQTVFALNGRIYIGTSGSSATGLYVIDFKADTIRRYNATNRSLSDQRVSSRNGTNTYTAESTIMKLPSAVINDVKAATIDGLDYIAVGTNGASTGAVSLIQEEIKKISNFGNTTATVAAKNVYLLSDGTLYYTYRDQNSNANDKLKVNYTAHKKLPVDANINATNNIPADVAYGSISSTNRGVSFGDATPVATINLALNFVPGPTFPDSTPVVNDLFVAKGTSTADPGRSNTIYMATDDGLVRIDEFQSQLDNVDKSSNPYTNYGYPINEMRGSVKYYTKDYITDAMYGDIRGMWGVNNNTASDLEDLSVKGNNLTNNGTVTFSASGVRGNAATFTAGSSQSLSSTATSLLPASAITVGAWVNPTTATTQKQVIAGKGGDLTNKAYRLGLHGTTPYFEVSENGSDVYTATASASLTASSWNHVVGVFKPSDRNYGASVELYVNGAKVGNSYNAPNWLYNTPSVFRIGNDDQYHTNVAGTVTATTTVYNVTNANTIFKVGDYVSIWNSTRSTFASRAVSAVSSTQLTVQSSPASTADGDSVTLAKINYGNPVAGIASSTTVTEGVTQEDLRIGDYVSIYNATANSANPAVISAVTETNVTDLTGVGSAGNQMYISKFTTSQAKFGTALDATFKIITGPNQYEFQVGDSLRVSRAANAGTAPTSSTDTVVTVVGTNSITVLDSTQREIITVPEKSKSSLNT